MSMRATRRTIEITQTLWGEGVLEEVREGGQRVTYKKPRAKTPTMAYFCLRGRFNDERTGIWGRVSMGSLGHRKQRGRTGRAITTKSLAIWRAAFAHHRLTGWQYTGVVKYKDQFQNASNGMHAVQTDTTNQIPMATTKIITIWIVFFIQL
jgi:hypothetical protein